MADTPVSDPSVWPAIIASLAPIVIGGVTTHYKLFLESKGDFRSRMRLQRTTLVEQLAMKLAVVLQHVRSLTEDDVMRGDGRETPDLIGEYMTETFRRITVFFRFEVLNLVLQGVYLIMLGTILFGIAGVIGASLLPQLRPYIVGGGVVVVIIQASSVIGAFIASCKLEVYEDVT